MVKPTSLHDYLTGHRLGPSGEITSLGNRMTMSRTRAYLGSAAAIAVCLLVVGMARAQVSDAFVVLKTSMVVSDSPYAESNVVSLLPEGTKVPVVGYTNGSWLVQLVRGKTGYLKDENLETVSELAQAIRRGDRSAFRTLPKEMPPAATSATQTSGARQVADSKPRVSGTPMNDAFIVPGEILPLRTGPSSDSATLPLNTASGFKLRVDGYDGKFWSVSTPLGTAYVEDRSLLEVSADAMVYRRQARLKAGPVPQPKPLLDPESMTPCTDPVYLKLRSIDINEMTEREFSVFVEKDRACNDYMVK